jgi:hypothetical protein
MQKVSRQQIFARAAKKLRQDFEELSNVPHAALKGHEAEDLVRRFLRAHLPRRFDVGSGFVIDSFDNISKQTDLIVYDALNCPVYRASDVSAIIPSDNVAAVIEVKSRLDKDTVQEAFENIRAVKGLAKAKPPEVPFLVTTQTFAGLFAFSSPLTLEKLLQHYSEFTGEYGLGRHIDVVLILDKGLLSLAGKIPQIEGWAHIVLEGFGGKAGEGTHIASTLMNLGEDSLDMFLRLLLGQLIHFCSMIGHPGFNWDKGDTSPQMKLNYLTSVTRETDPIIREKKLREYAAQVRGESTSSPAPQDPPLPQQDKQLSKAEPRSVIYLPPPDEPSKALRET